MESVKLDIDLTPSQEDIRKLADGLNQHALHSIGSRSFNAVAVWARDADNTLVGGIQAFINWNWIQICLVWLDESRRRQGLGSKMLVEIESIGRNQGCTQAHLDTFSFQARKFYERHGYNIYGTLEAYPPGQSRFYMRKTLC